MTEDRAAPKPRKTSLEMTQEREQNESVERHARETLNALIGERVIHALGAPGDLLKLWRTR